MSCTFCNREDKVVENELAFAIYDKYPDSKGHMLVITKRHISSFFDSTDAERVALFQLVDQCREIIESKHSPDGYNIGLNIGESAGQKIMHVHIHVIPRYTGDLLWQDKKIYRPSIKGFFSNWKLSDKNFSAKLKMALKNNIIKLKTRRHCCGNHGEVGC